MSLNIRINKFFLKEGEPASIFTLVELSPRGHHQQKL